MTKFGLITLLPLALLSGPRTADAQSVGPTATPSSLSFTYQVNSTTLPAAGKVTVTLPTSSSTTTLDVDTATLPAWLSVTPRSGRAPLTLAVTVNPTSLTPGSYSGNITINTNPKGSNPAVVSVVLLVSNPPSTLVVTSTSQYYTAPTSGAASPTLTFSYTTGTLSTLPDRIQLDVASSGAIIAFDVTAANAKGSGSGSSSTPVWLRVNQSGQLPNLTTSGVTLSGSSVPLFVTIDMVTLATLNPGSYGGLITIAAKDTANGSATVAVNLVISAGGPLVTSIFPSHITAGPSVDPVLTINGDNFFSTSVVTIQQGNNPSITLSPLTLLSRQVLQAPIKAAYLAAKTGTVYPVVWVVSVINPAPANDPTPQVQTTTLYVDDPSLPNITSLVNSGSYLKSAVFTGTGGNPVKAGTSVAPREIISLFGQNLGPSTVIPVTPAGSPYEYPTIAGTPPNTVQVAFVYGNPVTTVLAPVIMVSSNQINCIVPAEVASLIGSATPTANVEVIYGGAITAQFPVTVVSEDPGLFTYGGLGQGQAAALNFDSSAGAFTINSSKNAAARGSTISLYATGMGDLTGMGKVTVTVTDSSTPPLTASKSYLLAISPSLKFTTLQVPSGAVNASYSTVLVTAGGTAPLTWSVSGLPPGISADNAGNLSGTPTAAGIYPVVVTVTDSAATPQTISKVYWIQIDATVTIVTASLGIGAAGSAYTPVTLIPSGGTGPYSWNSGALPAGMLFSKTTGVLSGTPTTPGIFLITFTVTDSSSTPLNGWKSFLLQIDGVSISTPALPNGLAGSAYVGATMTASGGTAPYTWTQTGLPAGMAMSAAGVLSGTPTSAGTSTVKFTVTDSGGLQASTSLALTVTSGMTITTPQLTAGMVGTQYSVTMAAQGGTGALTWSATGLPAGVKFDTTTPGLLKFTPTTPVATTLPNAVVASGATALADNTCRVDIDGQPAVVSYSGTTPGAIGGLAQINAIVPPTVKTGAAISITVSIGSATQSRRSQANTTIAVK